MNKVGTLYTIGHIPMLIGHNHNILITSLTYHCLTRLQRYVIQAYAPRLLGSAELKYNLYIINIGIHIEPCIILVTIFNLICKFKIRRPRIFSLLNTCRGRALV